MTILELREKRAKAWEAAKAFLDSHRNDKGVLSAEDDAAYSDEVFRLGLGGCDRETVVDLYMVCAGQGWSCGGV